MNIPRGTTERSRGILQKKKKDFSIFSRITEYIIILKYLKRRETRIPNYIIK